MLKETLLVLATLVMVTSARLGGFLAGGFRIDSRFSCDGRQYGFYADVENNCKAYHVCEPVEDETGTVVETAHYTFMCGQNTVFNQQLLVCCHPNVAHFDCNKAESIYEEANLKLRQEAEARENEAKLRKAISV